MISNALSVDIKFNDIRAFDIGHFFLIFFRNFIVVLLGCKDQTDFIKIQPESLPMIAHSIHITFTILLSKERVD